MNFYLALFKDILGQRSFEIILKYFPPQFGSQKSWLTLEIKIKIMAKLSLNWQLKNIFLKLSFKLPQKQNLFIFIEVRSSTFEVRVRLEFSPISSRCSKFGHAKVRVFKVRNFWVRSNTSQNCRNSRNDKEQKRHQCKASVLLPCSYIPIYLFFSSQVSLPRD